MAPYTYEYKGDQINVPPQALLHVDFHDELSEDQNEESKAAEERFEKPRANGVHPDAKAPEADTDADKVRAGARTARGGCSGAASEMHGTDVE